jgi:hypothetical protein
MAKRESQLAIYCTPERMKKGREMVIEARDRGSAGNVIVTGQTELQECALDVLYRRKKLGGPRDARDRFNAGMWLRTLYVETHPSDGVGAYSVRLDGMSGSSERDLTDAEAWNLKAYQDTAKDLHSVWRILEQVCCDNIVLANLPPVWAALDRLRELREGFIPDYLHDRGE